MPHLQSLWSEVQQKWGDKVVFLCVNIGDDKKVIEEWWSQEKFTLRAVQQEGDAVSRAFGVQAYPTNYILGPDGKVLWRAVGFDEDNLEVMRKTIEAGVRIEN
ncbi:MAG: TlpA family protein disulfide reductase [Planctomycetota bacterium]|nr:MAG: TlpA family protein disulfide reductase [Planctomycetota bacterium]